MTDTKRGEWEPATTRSGSGSLGHRGGRHRRRLFRGMLRSYWLMLSLLVLVLSGLAMVQVTESSRPATTNPGAAGGSGPQPSDTDSGGADSGGTATSSPMTDSTSASAAATPSPADAVPSVSPVVPVASASAALTPAPSVAPSVAPPATCRVNYAVQQWIGGFVASVQIVNTSSTPISGWVLQFSFPGDQAVTDVWDMTLTQSDKLVTGESVLYNRVINPGQSVVVGFRATYGMVNSRPAGFTVNGRSCEVG